MMQAHRRFERSTEQIPLARAFVRTALTEWGVPGRSAATPNEHVVLDDIVLMASELITNAVLHGEGAIDVEVSLDRRCVRLAVADRGNSSVPRVTLAPVSNSFSGRGLWIVNRLAHGWGSRRDHRGGTQVWLEANLPPFSGA